MILTIYRGFKISGEIVITKSQYYQLITYGKLLISRPRTLVKKDPVELLEGTSIFNSDGSLAGLRINDPPGTWPHLNCRSVVKPNPRDGKT